MSDSRPDPLLRFRLDDRVIVVTGATSGLGVGFARAVVQSGATVVLAGRRVSRLEELAGELEADGYQVAFKQTDVADPQAAADLIDFAMARFGRVDGLVNNAGIGDSTPATRETPEHFRAIIDVNLNGVFWVAQACGKVMQPGSSIVNVSSVLGLIAPRFPQTAYAASKAGVIGLTRDLAQQWSARKGIRVNALCPGYFLTEMTTPGAGDLEPNVLVNSMLGRFGTQDELDPALIYLLSPASTYTTGSVLVVDGGMSAL